MASYNTTTINKWYHDKKVQPTPEQEQIFWSNVFERENEDFVRTTIVRYDLGHVLQQYINQRHEVFTKQLKTHPSYVQAHMECWWQCVCTKRTPNCTRVLHAFFSRPTTAMASAQRQSRRLEDMMLCNLWDLALESLSPQIDPNTRWNMLEKIMSNDGQWITKNDWSGTLKKLSIYLSNGGNFDQQDNKPYQHIFNTSWISDLLVLDRYAPQRTKMLKSLFRFGVHFNGFNLNGFPDHAVSIQLAWDQHTKEKLLKITSELTPTHTPKRKI